MSLASRLRSALKAFRDPTLPELEAQARAEAARQNLKTEPDGAIFLLIYTTDLTGEADGTTMGSRTPFMVVPALPVGLDEGDLPSIFEAAARAATANLEAGP